MPTAIIIDDSPIMRIQIRNVLTGAGFVIAAEAGNAEELISLYEQHRPDLVSLDIVMPGRDGSVAASELMAAHPEATIVMCTSMTTREKVLACQRAGVAHYLLKPFKPDHAAAIYRTAVERQRKVAQ